MSAAEGRAYARYADLVRDGSGSCAMGISICRLSMNGAPGLGRELDSLDSAKFARMSVGTRLAVKRRTSKGARRRRINEH